ncbi:MAG: flagellar biosynthesis protein FlhB [Rhodospirillaceae bacterium]|nr:flagellar biosynthesis protein FlhB [Rhodospirillaceae bacterium]
MSEDKDAKTEEPTAKRLGKAREEGNIPVSQEVKSVSMLVGVLIVVGILGPWVARDMSQYLRVFLERPETISLDNDAVGPLFVQILWRIGVLLAFPVFVLVIAAFIGTLAQVGLVYTPKKIEPKIENISPIAGFRRLFSLQSLIEAGKAVIKIVLISAMVGLLIVPTIESPDWLMGQDVRTTLRDIHHLMVMILFLVVLVMGALAAADYIYQNWSHKEKLKMTKQEVKDEHKEAEGDPKVKGKIRQLRLERHRHRMIAAVQKASVVITNPTHFAVALQYDVDSMAAPVVVAKGVDFLAKRMRQVAEAHDVPIVENPPLARALHAAVEVDQEIPAEHYKAVAEVIGYVMRLKGKFAK